MRFEQTRQIVLPEMKWRCLVNRRYVPELAVETISFQTGSEGSNATFVRVDRTVGSESIRTGDLVEVYADNNIVFRGVFGTINETLMESNRHTALDLRCGLNESYCKAEYNKVNPETGVKDVNKATVREIIQALYDDYLSYQIERYGEDAEILDIDLNSFPAVYPEYADIYGTPIGQAMIDILKSVSGEYMISVEALQDRSIIRCVKIGGNSSRKVQTFKLKNENINSLYPNIGAFTVELDMTTACTELVCEGEELLVERPMVLSPHWLTYYNGTLLTAAQTYDIILNLSSFTKSEINDETSNDMADKTLDNVYKRWNIPLIDDVWTETVGETELVRGEYQRQCPMESACVQEDKVDEDLNADKTLYNDISHQGAFLACEKIQTTPNTYNEYGWANVAQGKTMEDYYDLIEDGFTIKGSKLTCNKPLMEKRKAIKFSGTVDAAGKGSMEAFKDILPGVFISYDAQTGESLYKCEGKSFTGYNAVLGEDQYRYMLILTDWMIPYRILEFVDDAVVVEGNLSNCGVFDDATQELLKGGNFVIVDTTVKNPVAKSNVWEWDSSIPKNAFKTVYTKNDYYILWENKYAEKIAVLFSDNFLSSSPVDSPDEFLSFQIKSSSASDSPESNTSNFYVYGSDSVDVSEKTDTLPNMIIMEPIECLVQYVPYTQIILQTAYRSLERLKYSAGTKEPVLGFSRQLYVNNNDHARRNIKAGSFLLKYDYPPEVGGVTPTGKKKLFDTMLTEDMSFVKDDGYAELKEFGDLKYAAADHLKIRYQMALPFMPIDIKIGDRVNLNGELLDRTHISRITYDINQMVTIVEAQNYA